MRTLRNMRTFLAAMITLAALSGSALAQSNGSVVGTVKDSSGGVIPGATATIMDPAEGVTHTTKTGGDGGFIFLEIPPGTYTLSVESSGFKTLDKTNVVVPVSTKINVGNVVL